jgi:glyoxylase-like metal-dependent hydrolase (beta-lactamase superfamily II)
MKFGQYECHSLDLGTIAVDGGAMFGIIPRLAWEQKIPADDHHRIQLKTRALLIRGHARTILVDTGCGTKLSDDMKADYGIPSTQPDLNQVLSAYAVAPGDVTDVVLTHLHFDHAGGATVRSDDRVIPAFPNAVYYVQTEQWEEGGNPSERDRLSYLSDDFISLKENGRLQLLDGSLTLHDGIEIMVTYGHTKAQQHVVIRGEDRSLFTAADLVPTTAHIPVPWHMGFDSRPLDLFPEKDYFLRKAIRENWILHLPHDPDIEAVTLRQGDPWMVLDQVLQL